MIYLHHVHVRSSSVLECCWAVSDTQSFLLGHWHTLVVYMKDGQVCQWIRCLKRDEPKLLQRFHPKRRSRNLWIRLTGQAACSLDRHGRCVSTIYKLKDDEEKPPKDRPSERGKMANNILGRWIHIPGSTITLSHPGKNWMELNISRFVGGICVKDFFLDSSCFLFCQVSETRFRTSTAFGVLAGEFRSRHGQSLRTFEIWEVGKSKKVRDFGLQTSLKWAGHDLSWAGWRGCFVPGCLRVLASFTSWCKLLDLR